MEKYSAKFCAVILAGCVGASGLILAASDSDMKFAKAAAHGGVAEVELGKLAADKAKDPAVKAFGQQMVDDHGEANAKLKSIGEQETMKLPAEMDAKQKAMYTKLKALSGTSFDRAYVNDMVKDHEEDVEEFTHEASNASDPQLKQFAAETLPVIQGHLDKIKAIQAKMAGSSGSM